jgi:hypothetical protein
MTVCVNPFANGSSAVAPLMVIKVMSSQSAFSQDPFLRPRRRHDHP